MNKLLYISYIFILSCAFAFGQDTLIIKTIQADSNRIATGQYLKGLRNGIWIYFKNSKIEKIVPFDKGIINGTVLFFNDNQELTKELVFIDNKLNGNSIFYSQNGCVIAIINYRNNKKKKTILHKIDKQTPPKEHGYIPYKKEEFY